MTLADQIAADAADPRDALSGGVQASITRALERAERFVLTDDVARAVHQLIVSRPSSLLASMPLCRVPYPTTWIEWRSGLGDWPSEPSGDRDGAELLKREQPSRIGCLIESDSAGQRGYMTFAWSTPGKGTSACGFNCVFDYTGNLQSFRATLKHDDMRAVFDRFTGPIDDDEMTKGLENTPRWRRLAHDERERDAFRKLGDYHSMWYSHHHAGFMKLVAQNNPRLIPDLMRAWMGDITGEPAFVNGVLLLLNSRNAIDHEPVDLTRLNRARHKRGKRPIFQHRITRLQLSKARERAALAQGLSRAEARAHLVRGHFKVRATGVFWWSPFARGHHGTIQRKHYEAHA
jgi:hypothetical protein